MLSNKQKKSNSRHEKKSFLSVFVFLFLFSHQVYCKDDPRARDLGISPGIYPTGTWNAITDVKGVKVGQVTLINSKKSQQTGVTAILPHGGNIYQDKVPAGYYQANGFGKLMGTTQIIELGEIETPILLTNTLNVSDAAIGTIEWTLAYKGNEEVRSVNAVVGETNDGRLNDIRKRFVTPKHAKKAIETAKSGKVEEGNVGAGTGTVAFGFKGGIGSSSRKVTIQGKEYTIGVLVQANYGGDLHIMGTPVGRLLKKSEQEQATSPDGSVMIVIATDAPLSDRNLTRLAKRSILGIGRTGGIMSNGSGDYVLAFSTAESVRRTAENRSNLTDISHIPNDLMTPLFGAVIEATEESVYNALFAAVTVDNKNGQYKALPVNKTLEIIEGYRAVSR
ncbi:MAG: P1 family peptidase [Gammaproteobacteria bacterium]|nr:P1 family peptidase [Gammaproteobacteria bacterium]